MEIGGNRMEFVKNIYFLFFLLVYPFCLLVYFLIINWEVVRPKLANFEVKKELLFRFWLADFLLSYFWYILVNGL